MIEAKIVDLVRDKAAAEDAAPEWILAFAVMKLVLIAQENANTLKAIHSALDERDVSGSSLSERLHDIEVLVRNVLAAKG